MKERCYFCFIDELGICEECMDKYNYSNFCLNCIAYGNGDLCQNCLTMGDEGVSMEYDLHRIISWIIRNDTHFSNLFTRL